MNLVSQIVILEMFLGGGGDTRFLSLSATLQNVIYITHLLVLGIPLLSCGFMLVLWFLPVAFVHLSTTELEELGAWRRLRIFTAGVWHNLVLAGVAYLFLVFVIPAVFMPLFQVTH